MPAKKTVTKKASLKKPATKKLLKKSKNPSERMIDLDELAKDARVLVVKLTTGQDVIGIGAITDECVILHDPMSMTYLEKWLLYIMSPYLIASASDTVAFGNGQVVSVYVANESLEAVYAGYLETNKQSRELSEQAAYNTVKAIKSSLKRLAEELLSTAEKGDLAQASSPNVTSSVDVSSSGERSPSKLIDDLMKLAEKAGKGANAEIAKKKT